MQCIRKWTRHSRLYTQCTNSKIIRSFHTSPTTRLDYSEPDKNDPAELLTRNAVPPAVHKESYDYKVPYSKEAYRRQTASLEKSRFVDTKVIRLRSGAGGNGRVSFLRDANRARGPPDGGDGGSGGSVYIQAIPGMSSLHKLRFSYGAQDGQAGGSDHFQGKNGSNVTVQVPVGTVVRWVPDPAHVGDTVTVDVTQNFTGPRIALNRPSHADGEGWMFKSKGADNQKDQEYHESKDFFAALKDRVRFYDLIARRQDEVADTFPLSGLDLDSAEHGPVLLLRGGRGGMGNMRFHTPTIRNPRFARQGRAGIEAHFLLELRLLADFGLVGMPNAGKSTLLRAMSSARPRVGHWEFTTLRPTIGVVFRGSVRENQLTVADIPGIVEGASEFGTGLGTEFLRHVERSGGLVFVVALDRPTPEADLELLIHELGDRLRHKQAVVVATKADTEHAQERFETLRQTAAHHGWDCIACCGLDGTNTDAVVDRLFELKLQG